MAFKKGQSGNPSGRKRGIPNPQARIRAAMAERLDDILKILTERALEGDMAAINLIVSRCVAPAKAESTAIAVPGAGKTLAERAEAITAAALAGTLSPETASEFMGILGNLAKVMEIADLEARIIALEGGAK